MNSLSRAHAMAVLIVLPNTNSATLKLNTWGFTLYFTTFQSTDDKESFGICM